MQTALDALIAKGTQTIVVIAHRLSTIVNADKIIVTGNKAKDKLYRRHSGRPGGMKIESFEELQARIRAMHDVGALANDAMALEEEQSQSRAA